MEEALNIKSDKFGQEKGGLQTKLVFQTIETTLEKAAF